MIFLDLQLTLCEQPITAGTFCTVPFLLKTQWHKTQKDYFKCHNFIFDLYKPELERNMLTL